MSILQILDELGIGPNGPPIPQPIIFSIVQYPKKRSVPSVQPSSYYTFTVPASPEDMSEEKKDEDLASDNRGPVLSVKVSKVSIIVHLVVMRNLWLILRVLK